MSNVHHFTMAQKEDSKPNVRPNRNVKICAITKRTKRNKSIKITNGYAVYGKINTISFINQNEKNKKSKRIYEKVSESQIIETGLN